MNVAQAKGEKLPLKVFMIFTLVYTAIAGIATLFMPGAIRSRARWQVYEMLKEDYYVPGKISSAELLDIMENLQPVGADR